MNLAEFPVVTLDTWEMEFGGYGALMRSQHNWMRRVREKHGADSDWGGYDEHLMGVLGELAVAKWLDRCWTGGWGDFRKIDVGNCVNVRATKYLHGPYLRLHPADPDIPHALALTVRNQLPAVQLLGFMPAGEGRRLVKFEDKFNNNRPAYWVPLDLLKPMTRLRADLS